MQEKGFICVGNCFSLIRDIRRNIRELTYQFSAFKISRINKPSVFGNVVGKFNLFTYVMINDITKKYDPDVFRNWITKIAFLD